MPNIPSVLVESIRARKVVLFLGSGFAHGALHKDGKKPPLGQGLANLLSDKFLGGHLQGSSLSIVSDYAISETSVFEVQDFIRDLFIGFEPNESQIAFANFGWKAIFTTNYDRILEKAYDQNLNKVQELSVVYRNSNEQTIFKTEKSIPYYKLHGCISYIADENLQLILSTEQYIDHKKNRDRLFTAFKELSSDYTILFVGYSNQDPNIRGILKELDVLKDARPRYYMLAPKFEHYEKSYWQQRKIEPIELTYADFIEELQREISIEQRKLSSILIEHDQPIFSKFVLNPKDNPPTESLLKFLSTDAEYLHSGIKSKESDAKNFYKGFCEDWDPIIRNLDVQRSLKDRILEDTIINEKFNSADGVYLFCISGYAGSGKSVLLRRISWEAAITFEKLVIYLNQAFTINSEAIVELYNYAKERIYLIIDDCLINEQSVNFLVNRLKDEKVPVTIISSANTNKLNESNLQSQFNKIYTLTYLKEREIEDLLDKLKLHRCLGFLERMSREEQKNALSERANRVLLVALHEATSGKNFEEIILNEYKGISNPSARSLYLTVAILHKLGSYARAGLINRVHEVGFREFERVFFKPLEYIVLSEMHYGINDYVYKTRHPLIADMIFNLVLHDQQERFDEYVRLLSHLNVDYNSDKSTFMSLTKAKQLHESFSDIGKVRTLYDIAERNNPDNPKLLQQRAIYEMTAPGGNHINAEKYLKEALEIDPKDPLINHTLAESYLKKAESRSNYLEINAYLSEAYEISKKIIDKNLDQPHSYHTILKVKIHSLKEELKTQNAVTIEKIVKDFEKNVERAKQRFPEHEFILDAEAKFMQVIDNEPSAIEILKKAHKLNPNSPYISLRLSKILVSCNDLPNALATVSTTLKVQPNEKDLNFYKGEILLMNSLPDYNEASLYFRRAYVLGDDRYEAQYWYAVCSYMAGKFEDARNVFESLANAKVNPEFKRKGRFPNNSIVQFSGKTTKVEHNHGYIQRDKFGDRIFFNRGNSKNLIETNKEYNFNMKFNYYGPIAEIL